MKCVVSRDLEWKNWFDKHFFPFSAFAIGFLSANQNTHRNKRSPHVRLHEVNTAVVGLRHPSKGGPVGTTSDDGIRGHPSRLRVVGLKLALCEPVA